MISDLQRNKIFALFNELSTFGERSVDYLHGFTTAYYGHTSLNDLTQEQVDDVIVRLETRIAELEMKGGEIDGEVKENGTAKKAKSGGKKVKGN